MTYQDQLSPWVVYKLLPTLQTSPVARFRYRNDAESYLKLVTRILPDTQFTILFDGPARPVAQPQATGAATTSPKTARKTRVARRKPAAVQ